MLDPGDTAPDFDLPRNGGGRVTLSGIAPRKAVVYFYPKDNTPGLHDRGAGFHPAGR